jgi:chromosomal replication initiation ATPase DnaA
MNATNEDIRNLTIEVAKLNERLNSLVNSLNPPRAGQPLPTEALPACLAAVHRHFKVAPNLILSINRQQPVAEARFAAALLLSDVFQMKALRIARLMNRDHAAIGNALKRARDLRAVYPPFKLAIGACEHELRDAFFPSIAKEAA